MCAAAAAELLTIDTCTSKRTVWRIIDIPPHCRLSFCIAQLSVSFIQLQWRWFIFRFSVFFFFWINFKSFTCCFFHNFIMVAAVCVWGVVIAWRLLLLASQLFLALHLQHSLRSIYLFMFGIKNRSINFAFLPPPMDLLLHTQADSLRNGFYPFSSVSSFSFFSPFKLYLIFYLRKVHNAIRGA